MRLLRGRTSITRSVVSGVTPLALVLRVRCLFWCCSACWVSALDSGGIKSIHQFMTRSDLEKNRCPPMSIRLPLCRIVREMPPISWLASSTMGCTSERRRNSRAAVRPAGPAPMSRAVFGMKTPATGDGTLLTDEAHLYRWVAFPINNTVTGSVLDETLHSRWSKPQELRSRDRGEDS